MARDTGTGARSIAAAAKGENVVRVQSDIRDSTEAERLKRYTREQQKSTEMEQALDELNEIPYNPVDYTPSLVRKQFTEPAIPDYSYILTEARLKIANKYFTPLVTQLLLGLFFVLLSLAFLDSFVPVIGVAGLGACAISLHRDLKSRQRDMERALVEAKGTIDLRIREMRENIEDARQSFEEAENQRIERIEKLMSGDPDSVYVRMDEVLNNIKLPFYLKCTVDFYAMEPVVTLNLPDISVIPANTVTLGTSGNLEYNDKSPFELNKQYSEAMAGAGLYIIGQLYSHLPSLDVLYLQGIYDKWEDQECYFSAHLTREKIVQAAQTRTAFEALHKLEAEFDIKTSGNFSPVQPILPDWWETAQREKIRSLKVVIPNRFA